jgi:hypothetical protein
MGLFRRGSSEASDARPIFQLWGQRGWGRVDVAGESYHLKEIRSLLPPKLNDESVQVTVPVTLVHDPSNRHDANAVEIRASSGLIGFLPREEAVKYAPVISRLQQNGLTAATTANIWAYEAADWNTGQTALNARITLDLAEPHMLVPVNLPPTKGHAILPTGNAIQVTGEEKHLASLAPYLNDYGEAWVYATVHAIVEQSTRTSKTLAEIRIDESPVGRLTPKMSSELLPAVEHLGQRGLMTCVQAIVKGNALKTEVVLYTVRAHELTTDWLSNLATGSNEAPPAAGLAANTAAEPLGASAPPTATSPATMGSQEQAPILSGTMSNETAPPTEPLPLAELPPQLAVADWYPDPAAVARLRYWDGESWTEHIAD